MRILDPRDPEDAKLIAATSKGQCARCGTSIYWENCPECGGPGHHEFDYGDGCDVDGVRWVPCDVCGAEGGFWFCLSSREWCEAHPLPGREDTERSTVEWFDTSVSEERE